MKGKWLFAVSAILLTVLSMSIACGCGSDEGTENPPPSPNDGGFQLGGGSCDDCSQAGFKPMKAGSYLTIAGTTYDLTFDCRMVTVESTDAPIHTIRMSFFDGSTRDYCRYDKSTYGNSVSFEVDKPIESIQVKLQDDKYSGSGLGPKFKCNECYDPADYF